MYTNTIMNYQRLSDRIINMGESATLKMAQLARELTAQGHKIISLSLGEPDFDTPEHIKKAASKALEDGYTKYTPVAGLLELRQAICTKFERDNKLKYTATQIVVSNGAKQCIANLSMSLLQEGDEAIVLSPYWVSYKEIIELSGAVPVFVKGSIEQDFKATAAQVSAAITANTRMLIFSSPCNPTGSVFTREELKAIADVLVDHPQITIVSDEIYEYINFTGEPHISIAEFDFIKDRVVIVNGFSKGFAMTGWRLGYIAAPQWIADACVKMQGQFTSGAASFSQKAAVTALLADLTPSFKMTEEFHKRRDLFVKLLSEIPGFKVNNPTGAFYVFPDVSYYYGKSDGSHEINNADDLCDYLLYTGHVALVSGDAFGAPECVRLSYSLGQDDLREAVRRIKEAVLKLS
jgi:aspartate aminotransferase